MAAELSGRYLRERPGYASEALSVNTSTLTCVGNDYGYDYVFSRQVEAFAQPGDVVDRHDDQRHVAQRRARAARRRRRRAPSRSPLPETAAARSRTSPILVLLGPDGYAAIVQEVHQVMAHIVCDLVEQRMIFGTESREARCSPPTRGRSSDACARSAILVDRRRDDRRMDLGFGDAHLARSAGAGRRRDRSFVHARRRGQRREQPARARRATSTFVGTVGDDAFADQVRAHAARRRRERRRVCRARATGRPRARRASSRTTSRSCAPIGSRRRRSPPPIARALVRRSCASARPRATRSSERLRQGLDLARRSSKPRSRARWCSPIPSRRTCDCFAGRHVRRAQRARSGRGDRRSPSSTTRRSRRAGSRLLERLQCRYVVITRGEHGMALFGSRRRTRWTIPSVARNGLRRLAARATPSSPCSRWRSPPAAPIERGDATGEFCRRRGRRKARHGDGERRRDSRAGRTRPMA